MVNDEAACDEDKGLGPTPRPSATILVDLPPPVPETTILPSCPPPYDHSKTTYVVGDMVEVKSNIFTCREEDGYEMYCNIPYRPKDENAEMMWRNAWIHLGPCTMEEVEDKDDGDGNEPIRALRASASKDEKPLQSLSSILTPRHIDYSAHKPLSSSHHGSKASKNKKVKIILLCILILYSFAHPIDPTLVSFSAQRRINLPRVASQANVQMRVKNVDLLTQIS